MTVGTDRAQIGDWINDSHLEPGVLSNRFEMMDFNVAHSYFPKLLFE